MKINKYNIFYFEKFSFDLNTLKATFYYNFDNKLFFKESIDFLDNDFVVKKNLDLNIINNILFHIHIALWISYYKFYPTKNLVLKTWQLDYFQIKFWKKFYLNWLGEFFYKNEIDPNWLLEFKSPPILTFSPKGERNFYSPRPWGEGQGVRDFQSSEKYLVPVWWWKDSIVSIELLKKMWKNITLITFWVNDNILYENTAKNSWYKRLFIKRKLDEKNILNIINSWAYNWHVPITGMIAFVLELVSYIYDYKYIVLSNEASANFENTVWKWVKINHQWSKSLDFEKDFAEYTKKYISNEVKYFSLLRPFYELKIAELFSKYWKKYFDSFSSCNTNFKIFKNPPAVGIPLNKGELKGDYWCNSCSKCVFVYSILRPFLSKKETLSIFGHELYEDKNLEKFFKELAWISWIKPFECVGTNEEVILAMKMSADKWEGKLPFILEIFENDIKSKMSENDFEKLKQKILTPDFENNLIPKDILDKLRISF